MTDDDFKELIIQETNIEIGENEIRLPENKPATESYTQFIRFLFNQGYLSEEDLPIESGYSRYILNTEPIHKDGQEMTRPNEVISGVFLERNHNKEGIKRRIRWVYRMTKDDVG